jgi:type II secretory pathway component GspD/PulD (secretin)
VCSSDLAALDGSIANISSIKVFQLHYADAKQVANEIQQLFTPQSSQGGGGMSGRAQLFSMFRGGGGFGGPGGPGGSTGTSGNGANAAGTKVVATSDDYSNSLIVSAAEDLMKTITDMIQQLDVPTSDVTELRVFKLVNADPVELADQIAQLFPNDTRSASDPNQGFGGGFRFFGGRGARGGATTQTTSSDRAKKKSQVVAVPDPRTSSLLVSAAGELMPQLAEMIEQLDASAAKKEVVQVFDLKNADPQDVNQVLQDLFNRNNTMKANNTSSRSMLGNNNPLTQRETQQINSSPSLSTGFGNTRGAGGGLGGN